MPLTTQAMYSSDAPGQRRMDPMNINTEYKHDDSGFNLKELQSAMNKKNIILSELNKA